MRIPHLLGTACLSLLLPRLVLAAPGQGTLADPLVVDAFPYALASTTTGAPSDVIDSYDCAATLDESGPERVFRFRLDAAARVTAWVSGDGGGTDIDVHLLEDASLSGTQATSCVARGNTIAEADMEAGEHLVVVDSYAGAAQAGDFVLKLYAIGDAWVQTVVADGVVWRARRFTDLSGGQVIHELIITPGTPGVSVRSVAASGCQTVSSMGQSIQGAVAGINGGFFVMNGTCPPVSMLKEDGVLLKSNDRARGSFGISSSGEPLVDTIAAGADWPEAYGAHGGGPTLVVGGVAYSGQAAWSAQQFTDTSWNGINPRTVAGIDAQGATHFFTADGRQSPVAVGMSLDDLAEFSAGPELGLVDVVNLDGGGSTTLWVAGATPNGVVNYPSGGGLDNPDHGSQRAVSGGFFVIAPEYNHPPRFQTQPELAASAGTPYTYDADAIDLDAQDTVTFSLDQGPAGMTVDPDSGVVAYEPAVTSTPTVDVTILASDGRGGSTPQSYTLTIAGATGPGDGGPDSGGEEDSGVTQESGVEPDSGGAPESGVAPDSGVAADAQSDDAGGNPGAGSGATPEENTASGCACRAAPTTAPSILSLVVLGLAGLASRRRRA